MERRETLAPYQRSHKILTDVILQMCWGQTLIIITTSHFPPYVYSVLLDFSLFTFMQTSSPWSCLLLPYLSSLSIFLFLLPNERMCEKISWIFWAVQVICFDFSFNLMFEFNLFYFLIYLAAILHRSSPQHIKQHHLGLTWIHCLPGPILHSRDNLHLLVLIWTHHALH